MPPCAGASTSRRLEIFGSVARRADFDPARSDVNVLVTYDPNPPGPSLADYFDLRYQLTALFGWPVDLVMANAVENPFVRAGIERSKEVLYAA